MMLGPVDVTRMKRARVSEESEEEVGSGPCAREIARDQDQEGLSVSEGR